MKAPWGISCGLVLVCISQALALDCLTCKGRGTEDPCAQKANEQGVLGGDMEIVTCPEPTQKQLDEGLRAVCMKIITVYDSFAGDGGVSSRYCDLVDYKDMCWTEDGGTTDTEFCACSNEDKCNSAMATITSLVTIMAAIFVSLKLL